MIGMKHTKKFNLNHLAFHLQHGSHSNKSEKEEINYVKFSIGNESDPLWHESETDGVAQR